MLHKFFRYLYHNQILLALFIVSSAWLFIQIIDIIMSVFLAYIILSSILPYVKFLEKKGLPKVVAVSIPYFTVLVALFLLVLPLIPFFLSQIQNLILKFPLYLKQALLALGLTVEANQIQTYFSNEISTIGESAFTVTTKLFGGVFSMMMVIIVSFYMLLYYEEFKKAFSKLFNIDKRAYVLATLDEINYKLGGWLRGEIILMGFIGVLSWIALTALGIPNALPLALLSGLLEIVPTLGPFISAIPAVIVALTISPTMALSVIVIYTIIQLVENNFLVPKVMEKAVGLNPVVVILGILIGANLIGASGALLAIPLMTFVIAIFKSLEQKPA